MFKNKVIGTTVQEGDFYVLYNIGQHHSFLILLLILKRLKPFERICKPTKPRILIKSPAFHHLAVPILALPPRLRTRAAPRVGRF